MQGPLSQGEGELPLPCSISYLDHGDITLPIWLFGEGRSAGGEDHEKEIKWLRQQTLGVGLQPRISSGSRYLLLSWYYIHDYL